MLILQQPALVGDLSSLPNLLRFFTIPQKLGTLKLDHSPISRREWPCSSGPLTIVPEELGTLGCTFSTACHRLRAKFSPRKQTP
jgi:hypothetical protein